MFYATRQNARTEITINNSTFMTPKNFDRRISTKFTSMAHSHTQPAAQELKKKTHSKAYAHVVNPPRCTKTEEIMRPRSKVFQ